MDEEGEEEEGDRDNVVKDEEEEGDKGEDEEEQGDGDNMEMKQYEVLVLALYVVVVNQLVSPQLFTACKEGRVEDVVQLLSSGVGANVTDWVSKVCVQVWVQICMHGYR